MALSAVDVKKIVKRLREGGPPTNRVAAQYSVVISRPRTVDTCVLPCTESLLRCSPAYDRSRSAKGPVSDQWSRVSLHGAARCSPRRFANLRPRDHYLVLDKVLFEIIIIIIYQLLP